jgi:hypothetical protein
MFVWLALKVKREALGPLIDRFDDGVAQPKPIGCRADFGREECPVSPTAKRGPGGGSTERSSSSSI